MTPTKKYIWPWHSVEASLASLDRLFETGGPIVEVKGFPLRIFVSKHVDFAAAVFSHPRLGMTKNPSLMPRMQKVMRRRGGFILKGGEEWRLQRNAVQESFRPQNYDGFLALAAPALSPWIDRWAAAGRGVEVFADLRRFYCGLNFRMLFGLDLEGDDLRRVEEATYFIDLQFLNPLPLWVPTPGNLKFNRCRRVVDEAFDRAVARRRAGGPDPAGLLENLLSRGWDRDRLLGEMASIYFGASILATTTSWALSLIGAHPSVEARLAAEAAAVDFSGPSLRDGFSKAPYVQAVVKEVLRLYPSSWGFPRHAEEDLDIMGCAIPRDSMLVPLTYLTHRDPRHWPDPLAFKPERFLHPGEEQNKFAYSPFSKGPRACLGGGLASYLIPLVLLGISRRLRYKLEPRFPGDPRADFGFEIHPADGVVVRFSPAGGAPPSPSHGKVG